MLLSALLLASAPDFATRLWRALPTDRGNVVVSPASVEACLGLLIPATGTSSKGALAKTLGTSAGGLDAYGTGLQKRMKAWTVGGETTVANAGFFAEAPRPSYVAAAAKYGATVERLKGLAQVNGWVEEETKGRIPKLFERLSPATHAVLVNAITFDGDWTTAFPKAATEKATFGGSRTVDLMHLVRTRLSYAEGRDFRMVRIPYKGGQTVMSVLLPKEGDPARLLRDAAWRSVEGTSHTVDLSLPRFTVRSAPQVEDALKAMGLAPLFARIDLSPALPGGAHDAIDQIVHRTYVKVDETGTQAAAATGIAMPRSMPSRPDRVVFRVDRPFAFAIQRAETGEILFQGVIREP